jgi:hypothetical protein
VVSHNTEKLQSMAKKLQDTKLDENVTEKVRKLGIPAIAWPLMAAFGAASQYDDLRETTEKAAHGLDTVVKALGGTINGVASYYAKMEEKHGNDFDTEDAKLKGDR